MDGFVRRGAHGSSKIFGVSDHDGIEVAMRGIIALSGAIDTNWTPSLGYAAG